jgi:hypothetical protein
MHAIFDRDPASARRRALSLSEKNDKLRGQPERIVAGDGDRLLDYLQGFVKAGCRNFITYFTEPNRHLDNIAGFGEEVIPQLSQLG